MFEARQYEEEVLTVFEEALPSAEPFAARLHNLRLVGQFPDTELRVSFRPQSKTFRPRRWKIWDHYSEWGRKSAYHTALIMFENMITSRGTP
jgi:hypothetical protein